MVTTLRQPESEVSPNRLFYVLLFSILVFFRIAYSTPIELDFDTLERWYIAGKIAEDWDFRWLTIDLHTMRWSLVIPQVAISSIFANSFLGYYVLPVLGYSFFTVFLVRILERFFKLPHWLLLIVAIAVTVDPMSQIMASQLKTNVFGMVYVVLGSYFGIVHIENRRFRYLALSICLFFCAYGAHLSYIFFFIGGVVFLATQLNGIKYAVIAVVLFALLLLMETLLFGELYNWQYVGRLDALYQAGTQSRHIQLGEGAWAGHNVVSLGMARFRSLPGYQKLTLLGYVASTLLLFAPFIRKKLATLSFGIFWSLSAFLIFVTFAVVKFDPLTPLFTLRPRYLAPFFPIAVAYIALMFWQMELRNINQMRARITLIAVVSLFFAYVVFTAKERCNWEAQSKDWSMSIKRITSKGYCGMFRYLNNQNIVPTSPTFFLLKADHFYRKFAEDFENGDVAIPGGGLAPLYEIILRHYIPNIEIYKTKDDRYSIDGKIKDYCVDDLGRFKNSVISNYYMCSSIGDRSDDTEYINFARLGLKTKGE
jgi:hypothetical protein